MSTPRFEAFLARLYTDEALRTRFLADPRGEAARAGLTEPEIAALESIDRAGLQFAADSLSRKRDLRKSGRFRRIFQA